jgi:hypothetical protein
MPKASPMVRSFNGGVFSALMEGRTDIDRYPASMRKLYNCIAAPQGPALSRSGTELVAAVARHDEESVLIPFVFNETQSLNFEFASDRIRFVSEDGIQIYTPVATTVASTSPFVITAPGLGADVSDDVALGGYPDSYNLNGETARVLSKAGNDYTLDITWPVGRTIVAATVGKVYSIPHPYTLAQCQSMRTIQSVDTVYLLCGTQPRKLARYGTYDWRLIDVVFLDGPYLPINETPTTITPDGTGNAIPVMTTNTLPSGVAGGSGNHPAITADDDGERDPVTNRKIFYDLPASDFYKAFNDDNEAYWASNTIQKGVVSYTFAAATSIDGYVIYCAKDNADPDYAAKDYSPSSWTLEGSNTGGAPWTVVDTQNDYVLFDNSKTRFIELDNPVSFSTYRLNITKLYRNGQMEARVRRLVLRGTDRGAAALIATGTQIGNTDARLANAFDGITSQSLASSAQKNSAVNNSVYVGRTLAAQTAISKVKMYGSNNSGFANAASGQPMTLSLYAKTGAAPANGTDGTLLGQVTFADTLNESAGRTILSNDTTTYWDHVWVNVSTVSVSGNLFVAEFQAYGWANKKFITLTASSTEGINQDQGFLPTDVGRLVRIQGSDNYWRSLRINAFVDTTHVIVTLEGEPFPDLKSVKNWRLGYWSDTTGWPTCGDFFEDRLALNGGEAYPDMFALSVVGFYETFSQTDVTGAVLDDSAVVARLNARKLSGIKWMASDEQGLLLGTGSGEYLLNSAKGDIEAVTARNIKARNSTSRGSASVEPTKIDRQVLYVQRSGRTLREMAFVFEADGYKSPSMSQLASHLGVKQFVEMDYASEPHSLVWIRREDDSVVAMTYNRDENVIGWHVHDFAGAHVESIAVLPQRDQAQDALWIIARRTINGQTRRYIEKLTRFWDFDMVNVDAHYVDSGLRYVGAPTITLYGLQHLEGETVYGLADAIPLDPLVVVDGSVTLPNPASNIVIGLGYDSEGETSRLDNGAADGTAIGKVGRIHNISLLMWESNGGEIGTWNDQAFDPVTGEPGLVVYEPMDYPRDASVIDQSALYTGEVGPIIMQPGYEKKNSVSFRRPKKSTLPFNILAIMPQMDKQDR